MGEESETESTRRRRVPWFQAHHVELFYEFPPPTAVAAGVARDGGWWGTRTWSALPYSVTAAPLRSRIGNLQVFRGSGPYAREQWQKQKADQDQRAELSGSRRGKKRTADGADAQTRGRPSPPMSGW